MIDTKTSHPAVSVIVPVFNSRKYLAQCVENILDQSFHDLELILVDDGSEDGSGEMCDHYAAEDTRVKVLHQKNSGVSRARNLGLSAAVGDYVIFADSDDFWCDNHGLEVLVKEARRTDAGVTRGDYRAVDEEGRNLFERKPDREKLTCAYRITKPETFLRHVIHGEFFLFLSLFRRNLIADISFCPEQSFGEDMDFYSRLFMKPTACVYVPLVFYAYRKTRTSLSAVLSIKKLQDSFGMCARFENIGNLVSNPGLRHYFRRRSVMMYYWTLSTVANFHYEDRKTVAEKLDLDYLRRQTIGRIFRYGIFNKSFVPVILPVNAALFLFRVNTALKSRL